MKNIVTYRNGLHFCTIFWPFIFLLLILPHNIKENKKFIASDFSVYYL